MMLFMLAHGVFSTNKSRDKI